jgi:hypothetical protein
MAPRSVGFVYILTNVAMPGMVKVGYTRRLSEDRARHLQTTGGPLPFSVEYRALSSHPADVERRSHELLSSHRINARREYFRVTVAEAEAAVQQACVEVAGIEAWAGNDVKSLGERDRVALTLRSGQWFVVLKYRLFAGGWTPIDVWQAHADGDLLELMGADSAEQVAGMSTDDEAGHVDPVPHLDRAGMVPNWPTIGRERLEPGQRLLWIGHTNAQDYSYVLFEFSSHYQVACRTRRPLIGSEGLPLVLNVVTEEPPEQMEAIARRALRLPAPRVWAPSRSKAPPNESSRGDRSAPASYWLRQLEPPA